ncbi:hypothetical protein COB57_05535 [Candidatus Peregrinibacteria bacterium]|nr:MAG: hypothetical protein COB57_05535 [Candidatus Peregrinibacteria bacterium]
MKNTINTSTDQTPEDPNQNINLIDPSIKEAIQAIQESISLNDFYNTLPQHSIIEEIQSIDSKEKISLSLFLQAKESIGAQPLNEMAEKIKKLTYFLNPVELFTPDNLNQTRDIFLKNKGTENEGNPIITYKGALKKMKDTMQKEGYTLSDIKKTLEEYIQNVKLYIKNIPDTQHQQSYKIMANGLYHKIRDDLSTLRIIEEMGDKADTSDETIAQSESIIAQAITTKYGRMEETGYKIAQDMYKNFQIPDVKTAENEGYIPRDQAQKLSRDLQYDKELPTLNALPEAERKFYYNADEIKEAFQVSLEKVYDSIAQWSGAPFPESKKFTIDTTQTDLISIDVRDKSAHPGIYIPRDRVIDAEKLLLLIDHEIMGHVFQSLVGSMLWNIGGETAKVDDERLYEGLAKRLEADVQVKLLGNEEKPPLPYMPIGIHMAQNGADFIEIFDTIKSLREKTFAYLKSYKKNSKKAISTINNTTWKNTVRVFRGHLSTENNTPFGFSKDLAYLDGRILYHQLEKTGFKHLISSGITQVNALKLLARIDFTEADLPQLKNSLAKDYWDEHMKERIFG